MPSKKGSTAYKARNARRQADNWIRSLGKIASSKTNTLNERAAARSMMKQFKQLRSETYKPKGTTKLNRKQESAIKQATAQIQALAGSAKMSKGKMGASNLFTQQQINLASKELKRGEVSASIYSKEEVKIFYRSTQRLWEAKITDGYGELLDTAQINRRIMKALHTNSLSEAFDIVMSLPQNQKALLSAQVASGEKKFEGMTEEERRLFEELEGEDTEDQKVGSPDYLREVVMIDSYTDFKKLQQEE